MAFTTGEVFQVTGVTRNRLQGWKSRGFVSPSIEEADGPGNKNLWSRADLYSIALFRKITDSGLTRELVADVISKGIIGNDFSEEDISKIACLFYAKFGEESNAAMILQPATRSFFEILDDLGLQGYDFIYIANFVEIKKEVYAGINKLTKDYWKLHR